MAIPTLRGSSQQALYPFTRTVSTLTSITAFPNGAEQRCAARPPLMSFDLPMSHLLAADKASWLTQFSSLKGRFGITASLTINGVTYSNLTLMDDNLAVVNAAPLQYNQIIKLRQVANYPYTPPSVGSSYPSMACGKVAQMPFTQVSQFKTSVTDNPFGPRFAFAWYGSSLSGFPTSYLRSWHIEYPLLSDADLATIETFFLGCQGEYKSFTFTDPLDTTAYTHVRFGMPDLVVQYLAPNNNSTTVTLVQTNGS